jgi:hypothetical protein
MSELTNTIWETISSPRVVKNPRMSSMARKRTTAKTSTINHAPPRIAFRAGAVLPRAGGLAAFVDGEGKGSAAGREAGDLLPPFVEALEGSELSPRTIQKHVDNL